MSPSIDTPIAPNGPSPTPRIDRPAPLPADRLPLAAYIANLDELFIDGLVSHLCGTGGPHPMDWQAMDANERAAFDAGVRAVDDIEDIMEYIETLRWPDD